VNIKIKSAEVLEEILKDFFSPRDINEFKKNFLSSSLKKSRQSSESVSEGKVQLDFELPTDFNLITKIDLLITFSADKLPKIKFLELLLFLSHTTSSAGEFATAIDLNKKIIKQTKNNSLLKNIAANAYLSLGEIYSRQAQWEDSFSSLKKAYPLFKELNDSKGCANSENLLGTIYGDMGNLKRAVAHFESGIAYLDESVDISLIGKIEINLGIINNIQGNYHSALSYLKRALVNFQKISEPGRIAEIRHNMGMVFIKQADYTRALVEFDHALETAIKGSFAQTIGIAYLSKAFVYALMKDFRLSEAYLNKAMEISYK